MENKLMLYMQDVYVGGVSKVKYTFRPFQLTGE